MDDLAEASEQVARQYGSSFTSRERIMQLNGRLSLDNFFVEVKDVFEAQTMGWVVRTIPDERGLLQVATSPDNAYTLTFRDFSSDAARAPFVKINGTMDVQEFMVHSNNYVLPKGPKIEIKFGE
jgi:hypothetical protein